MRNICNLDVLRVVSGKPFSQHSGSWFVLFVAYSSTPFPVGEEVSGYNLNCLTECAPRVHLGSRACTVHLLCDNIATFLGISEMTCLYILFI